MNLTVKYAEMLNINGMSENERKFSLRRVFNRDIQDNPDLKFLSKVIRPIKKDGIASMDTVFGHLTTARVEEIDGNGKSFQKSVFEPQRSVRLHWVRHHLDQGEHPDVTVFSYTDRKSRKDVIRTYIYNPNKKYVVVLEPQDSKRDYYLLSAYYLYESWGQKSIENKLKNKLPEVY